MAVIINKLLKCQIYGKIIIKSAHIYRHKKIILLIHFVTACTVSLSHGSFESDSGWSTYSNGYTRHSSSPQDGSYYIRVSDGAAKQHIDFHPLVILFQILLYVVSLCNSMLYTTKSKLPNICNLLKNHYTTTAVTN